MNYINPISQIYPAILFYIRQSQPTVMMFNLHYLVPVFLLFSCYQTCPTVYDFDYSTCAFYLNYDDSSCSTFDFHECEWQQCVAYYYDQDGYSSCISWEYFGHSDWNYCTAQCCDSGVTYSENSEGIQQCQDYLHRQFIKTLIIVFSVLGGVGVIVGVVVLFCCCRNGGCGGKCQQFMECLKAVFCCYCLRSRRQPSTSHLKQNIQIELTSPTVISKPMISKQNWTYEGVQNSKLKNYCSICLQQNPSIMLQCNHTYHRHCIVACMRKKQQCAICRSTQFNNIKIYCEECFTAYLSSTLLENMEEIEKQKFVCVGCQEANIYN